MARHLAKLGHRCFGFVGGRQETSTDTHRLGGFRQALTELGLELPPEHVVHGAFTYDSGYASARQLIALSGRPSALFCANDVIALGVMDAVYDAVLRIPQDVAIVGWTTWLPPRCAPSGSPRFASQRLKWAAGR